MPDVYGTLVKDMLGELLGTFGPPRSFPCPKIEGALTNVVADDGTSLAGIEEEGEEEVISALEFG
jgi:hypothetical protein